MRPGRCWNEISPFPGMPYQWMHDHDHGISSFTWKKTIPATNWSIRKRGSSSQLKLIPNARVPPRKLGQAGRRRCKTPKGLGWRFWWGSTPCGSCSSWTCTWKEVRGAQTSTEHGNLSSNTRKLAYGRPTTCRSLPLGNHGFFMVFPCIWDSKQQRFSDYGQVVVVAIPQFYQLTLPTQAIETIDLDDLRWFWYFFEIWAPHRILVWVLW